MARLARSLTGSRASRVAGFACALAGALVALVPSPAAAARPHGGHYYTPSEDLAVDVDLRVSAGGKRVEAASVLLHCGRQFRQRLPFRARPAGRIGADGSFAISRRHGRVRYRLHGRFVSSSHARIGYRVRLAAPTLVGRPQQWCTTGTVRAEADRGGVPEPTGCRGQRGTTVLATSTGRVFGRLTLVSRGSDRFFRSYVYACSFADDRPVALGPNDNDDVLSEFRLSGSFVAYAHYFICGAGSCPYSLDHIVVLDLRNGSLVRDVSSFPGAWAGVRELVLTEGGAIAWALTAAPQYSEPPPPQSQHDVWAYDSAGQRLLDRGPELDPESLTLSGSTVSWTNQGVTRSEELR